MSRCLLVALVMMGGCASLGAYDGERRFAGVVEGSQKISRSGEPSGVLMAFGAIGGLIHHAASGPTPTNLYFVRVSGEIITVQVDEEWASGSCVEIIPTRDAIGGRAYAYGEARLVRSDKCGVKSSAGSTGAKVAWHAG
jgi:hypothetical protein